MFEEKKLGKMLIENNLENVREMLIGNDSLRLFYLIVLGFIFRDYRTFEIRNDLIDSSHEFNGDIIVCDDGNIIYFKNQDDDLTNSEFQSILDVCYFLQDKCGGDVTAYLLCNPKIELKGYGGIKREGIAIRLASLKSFDGDKTLEILNRKLKNKENFTFLDFVYQLLLPYMNYADKKEYMNKINHYLFETMIYDTEHKGIEIIR